jgi:hypothetical protein
MKQEIAIIGMGEMAAVFARGFLKAGYPVYPVLRGDSMDAAVADVDDPALVLLAVAEKDFDSALEQVPDAWRSSLVLLQNELLPANWKAHDLDDPTVISVWFEKKPGQDYKVLVPSPVHGPKSELIVEALATLEIPAQVMASADDMLFELVRKNMYILCTNICGLACGGTVAELWRDHAELMNRVFDDVMEIQHKLTGQTFNRDEMLSAVLTAFDGDPDHKCMGRSAPQRLARALASAQELGIDVPELKKIATNQEDLV